MICSFSLTFITCRARQETWVECTWPLSPRMALHKKPSCRHHIKYSHKGSGVLQKPTVIYYSLLLHQEMQLEYLLLGESYTSILCSDAAGFSGPEIISNSQNNRENVCFTQMSPHFNLFPGKMDFEFSVPKTKGTIQTYISNRSKSKSLSWYRRCSRANSKGDWHMCKGTIDMEAYTGIVQRHILPSKWCLS